MTSPGNHCSIRIGLGRLSLCHQISTVYKRLLFKQLPNPTCGIFEILDLLVGALSQNDENEPFL